MIWCAAHKQSYSSSFNIFAVLAGIFLIRGGLKTAKWGRRLLLFTVASLIAAAVGVFFICPPDFFFALARHAGLAATVAMIFAVSVVAVSVWLITQLGRPEITEAQLANGIKPSGTAAPTALGAVSTVLLIAIWAAILAQQLWVHTLRNNYPDHGADFPPGGFVALLLPMLGSIALRWLVLPKMKSVPGAFLVFFSGLILAAWTTMPMSFLYRRADVAVAGMLAI